MKHRMLFWFTLVGPLTLAAQSVNVEDAVKGAEAQGLLRKIDADRKQLVEERRQALLLAKAAASPEAKLGIMLELQTAQKDRLRQLREDEAKVPQAIKDDHQAKRPKADKK